MKNRIIGLCTKNFKNYLVAKITQKLGKEELSGLPKTLIRSSNRRPVVLLLRLMA